MLSERVLPDLDINNTTFLPVRYQFYTSIFISKKQFKTGITDTGRNVVLYLPPHPLHTHTHTFWMISDFATYNFRALGLVCAALRALARPHLEKVVPKLTLTVISNTLYGHWQLWIQKNKSRTIRNEASERIGTIRQNKKYEGTHCLKRKIHTPRSVGQHNWQAWDSSDNCLNSD